MEKKILKSLKPFISFTWSEAVIIIFGWSLATVVTMLRPRIISELTDFGLVKGKFNIIVIWAFVLLGLSLLQYGNEFLQTSVFTKLSNRFIQNLYEGTFKKIIHAPLGVLQGRNQAEILNSISTDIGKISWVMDRNSLTMINYLFQIIGGIIGLFWLDYRMAIVVLIIVPIKQAVVMCMAKRKRKMSAVYLKTQQQFSAWFGKYAKQLQNRLYFVMVTGKCDGSINIDDVGFYIIFAILFQKVVDALNKKDMSEERQRPYLC